MSHELSLAEFFLDALADFVHEAFVVILAPRFILVLELDADEAIILKVKNSAMQVRLDQTFNGPCFELADGMFVRDFRPGAGKKFCDVRRVFAPFQTEWRTEYCAFMLSVLTVRRAAANEQNQDGDAEIFHKARRFTPIPRAICQTPNQISLMAISPLRILSIGIAKRTF